LPELAGYISYFLHAGNVIGYYELSVIRELVSDERTE
jgi:hypothetical protein